MRQRKANDRIKHSLSTPNPRVLLRTALHNDPSGPLAFLSIVPRLMLTARARCLQFAASAGQSDLQLRGAVSRDPCALKDRAVVGNRHVARSSMEHMHLPLGPHSFSGIHPRPFEDERVRPLGHYPVEREHETLRNRVERHLDCASLSRLETPMAKSTVSDLAVEQSVVELGKETQRPGLAVDLGFDIANFQAA